MSEDGFRAKREILEKILASEITETNELEGLKREISGRFSLQKVPSNAEILDLANEKEREEVISVLRRKPVRSISGVSVITVMPRPFPCPKESPCIYCPGGPDLGTPQSYTGEEPASARAKDANYDPKRQIKLRKKQLYAIGHHVDKVELIVFGGTFLGQPDEYQEYFIHSCIDAITDQDNPDLKMAKKRAETAKTKLIGVTFETRPDYAKKKHVDRMLKFGGTRVEMGVQTVFDDIYKITNREHRVEDVKQATRINKDSGLAVVYHMMPGLPGSTFKRDLEAFDEIFENPEFRPDMLKIYPCLVVKNTKLYEMWRSGEFDPLDGEEAVNLVAEMKKKVPKWVRIQRVQRDIPSQLIEAGVWKGNFRKIVQRKLEDEGESCNCIRCREVGHRKLKDGIEPSTEDINLTTQSYESSGGREVFISYEDLKKDLILGHLRLRIPSDMTHRPEVDEKTALVRMLYVFGELVSVGEESTSDGWQHRGLGREMLEEAEKLSAEKYDMQSISILSGIGTRPYYRRFGYELVGPYMKKEL